MAKKRENVSKRNVSLNIETYDKLEKYKIKLMSEKGDSRLTFDDVINSLLDKSQENRFVVKGTKTSKFGVSKREGHDASLFYKPTIIQRNNSFRFQANHLSKRYHNFKHS